MMMKKGFTLIELLIVVTIIAILSGAAIPYVQDYVEQSRTGRAKADLDEIKRAVMLYEVQYGPYTGDSIASLVGPFLTKATPDPWSNPYKVNNASSVIYSYGADGTDNSGDELTAEFRPRMAVTKVYYLDANGNGDFDAGDALHVKVCRPASITLDPVVNSKLVVDGSATALENSGEWLNEYTASFTFSTVPTDFKPGSSTLQILSGNPLCDLSKTVASAARPDLMKIVYQ